MSFASTGELCPYCATNKSNQIERENKPLATLTDFGVEQNCGRRSPVPPACGRRRVD